MMNKRIKGKKILFISPAFFGYEKIIKKELCRQNAKVSLVSSIFQKSIFYRIPLLRLLLLRRKRKRLLSLFAMNYDYLFVIKGDSIDDELLNIFNANNPTAYKILYLYDSLTLYPKLLNIFSYFDKIYSFDPIDCKNHNLKYRPLFYIDQYLVPSNSIQYDIASISSYYPNRLFLFKEFNKRFPLLSMYLRLYTSWQSLLKGRFSIFINNLRLFSIFSLPSKKVAKILSKSMAILDIPNEGQDGFTIRTIETLALKKKLITTNKNVLQADFYEPNNIFILDNNYEELDSFIMLPYKKLPQNILDKYTIKYFVDELFS